MNTSWNFGNLVLKTRYQTDIYRSYSQRGKKVVRETLTTDSKVERSIKANSIHNSSIYVIERLISEVGLVQSIVGKESRS